MDTEQWWEPIKDYVYELEEQVRKHKGKMKDMRALVKNPQREINRLQKMNEEIQAEVLSLTRRNKELTNVVISMDLRIAQLKADLEDAKCHASDLAERD